MNRLINWIKNRVMDEQYVHNVKKAQRNGFTYLPALSKDKDQLYNLPRHIYSLDIFLNGGWRTKK